MVEDTPDDLVHELFTQHFWEGHPLGRPILGSKETRRSASPAQSLREYFRGAYVAPNMIVSAAGQPRARARPRAGRRARSATLSTDGRGRLAAAAAGHAVRCCMRTKELEQSHICLGTNSYPQNHDDRYVSYILNTVLGGSMSSRLFQNVREKRGLAYSVFSGMSAYRDAGNMTIYAGCAADAVEEVIDCRSRSCAA